MKNRLLFFVFLILFLISTASALSESDAVLVLHFDEGFGNVVYDSSGHGNDGTIHGALWEDGISGKGLQYNGNGNFVEIPLNSPLNNDLSIEFWFNNHHVSNYQQRMVDLAPANYIGFQICIFTDGKIIVDNSGGPASNIFSKSSLNDGRWHYITGVRKGAVYQLYIDGIYIGSTSGSPTSYNRLIIGKRAAISNEYFNGIIDEVAVYPRALTQDEILSLYRSKKAGTGLLQTPAAQQSQIHVTQSGPGKYTVKAEGVVITQQPNSQTTTPQKDTVDFLSKNLIIIIIVLGCVSITSVVIVVKKKESQKNPQKINAFPNPTPPVPPPQPVPVQPVQPSPQPTPSLTQKSGPQADKVMNDLPRRKLKEIIAKYGSDIVHEPLKVKGLLLDYCAATQVAGGANYQKEIHLLGLALAQNIPQDLLSASHNELFEFKRNRLQKRLTDLAVEGSAAKWAVDSWAEALGIS